MGTTKIAWCASDDGTPGKTWNPVMGCTPVSEACEHCYARSIIRRFAGCKGWPASPDTVTLFPERLQDPLRWKKPQRIFVCSMSDLFHEDVPAWFIDRVLEVIAACPQHTFMLLTKRTHNIERKLYDVDEDAPIRELGGGDYLPNVWLGVTAENQARANERIPLLLQIPAAVHFVSIEPMLGPVDICGPWWDWRYTYDYYKVIYPDAGPPIDWVIVGGETGPGARLMKAEWARSVRDQCQRVGVPFFMKQMSKKGVIPDDLKRHEFPL